jgi:hypothetical protein
MGLNLDPSDGVFINVGGKTGEMVTDPNTGELKVVVGSNQPIAGGPGGSTLAGASGQPSSLAWLSVFQSLPVWVIPLAIFGIVLIVGGAMFSRRG